MGDDSEIRPEIVQEGKKELEFLIAGLSTRSRRNS